MILNRNESTLNTTMNLFHFWVPLIKLRRSDSINDAIWAFLVIK